MTAQLKTSNEMRIEIRDHKAIDLFHELARTNMNAPISRIEETIAAEMTKQGYDLTTRKGVHGMLLRRGVIRED